MYKSGAQELTCIYYLQGSTKERPLLPISWEVGHPVRVPEAPHSFKGKPGSQTSSPQEESKLGGGMTLNSQRGS